MALMTCMNLSFVRPRSSDSLVVHTDDREVVPNFIACFARGPLSVSITVAARQIVSRDLHIWSALPTSGNTHSALLHIPTCPNALKSDTNGWTMRRYAPNTPESTAAIKSDCFAYKPFIKTHNRTTHLDVVHLTSLLKSSIVSHDSDYEMK